MQWNSTHPHKKVFYSYNLYFRVPNENCVLIFGINFGSKTADNGRYYRPIISVTLVNYRYRPILFFAVSVVHYNQYVSLWKNFHQSSFNVLSKCEICFLVLQTNRRTGIELHAKIELVYKVQNMLKVLLETSKVETCFSKHHTLLVQEKSIGNS